MRASFGSPHLQSPCELLAKAAADLLLRDSVAGLGVQQQAIHIEQARGDAAARQHGDFRYGYALGESGRGAIQRDATTGFAVHARKTEGKQKRGFEGIGRA